MTGANGFVGTALCERLLAGGFDVTAVSRARGREVQGIQQRYASLDDPDSLVAAFSGAACVVHLAARVHVMNEMGADALSEFRRVNVAGSVTVARAAATAGVRRIVYVSSIKVNGERTLPGEPFSSRSVPKPIDAYGISKLEAEAALAILASETGFELVIVRPVLVYGPGVKGNFLTMMKWIEKRIPLPLGSVKNRRSIVGVDNLADLLVATVTSPAAAGRTFLVSDGEDVSTAELIRRLAKAMHRPAILVPVPLGMLTAFAALVRRGEQARRLLESLQVDISETRSVLSWEPPYRMADLLSRTVRGFGGQHG